MRLHPSTAILLAIMLGSCSNLPQAFTGEDAERLEIADVNARNAISRVDALESRVSDLEGRLGM